MGRGHKPGGARQEGTCVPESTEAHGVGPLPSLPVGPTGTRSASAASCAQEPPRVCKAPKAPPKPTLRRSVPGPFHPAGPRSSGQTTSGSDEAIPLCPVASLPGESNTTDQVERALGGENAGAGGGCGPRRHSPGLWLVPRQPRRQTQALLGVGTPRLKAPVDQWPGGGTALTGGRGQPSSWQGLWPSSGRQAGPWGRAGGLSAPLLCPAGGQGRAEPRADSGRSRPSAAGPQTPDSTFPGPARCPHRLCLRPSTQVCRRPILYLGLNAPSLPRGAGNTRPKTTILYHFTPLFLKHEIKLFKS